MYETFSQDYDRFVDWEARLRLELPFLEEALQSVGARRVLDAACGTGRHAVALAQQGYEVVGTDLSPEMVARARAHAQATGVSVRVEVAGFGTLAATVGTDFDALLCLGNSLPHLLTEEDLAAALRDFAACLRPGGALALQNLNYDRILARREAWLPLQAHREGEDEWLFLRHYEFDPDGLLTFQVVVLRRQPTGEWNQQVLRTKLRPWRERELSHALEEAGFHRLQFWGDMQGGPFEPEESGNLVVTALRAGAGGEIPEGWPANVCGG
ncbi:MAG: class I SAM-dependent methyltransferase [Anaerolineae bacterium]|nr:class I SAM-dependent methyltransferase [Anaerolineae bacterium]